MREQKRVDISIGGRSLRAVDSGILIPQITEDPPEYRTTYAEMPGFRMYRDVPESVNGQRTLTNQIIRRRVTAHIQIRELYDLEKRARTLDKINAWARDGRLTVSYRPGLRLAARCVGRPAMGNARDTVGEYTVVFEAAESPYWEDVTETRIPISGSYVRQTITVPGNMPCVLQGVFTTSGALTKLDIDANSGAQIMSFDNMEVPSGARIGLEMDEFNTWVFGATYNYEYSLFRFATANCADLIMLNPGENTITFDASTSCSGNLYVRGLWA